MKIAFSGSGARQVETNRTSLKAQYRIDRRPATAERDWESIALGGYGAMVYMPPSETEAFVEAARDGRVFRLRFVRSYTSNVDLTFSLIGFVAATSRLSCASR